MVNIRRPFTLKHSPCDQYEQLFFRGFAGENAYDDLVKFHAQGSGYCSQEKQEVEGSKRIFEIFWDPEKTKVATKTTRKARAVHEVPRSCWF
jgi:hypothetical protein